MRKKQKRKPNATRVLVQIEGDNSLTPIDFELEEIVALLGIGAVPPEAITE